MKDFMESLGVVILLVSAAAGPFAGGLLSPVWLLGLTVLVVLSAMFIYSVEVDGVNSFGGRSAITLGIFDIVMIWAVFFASHALTPDFLRRLAEYVGRYAPF